MSPFGKTFVVCKLTSVCGLSVQKTLKLVYCELKTPVVSMGPVLAHIIMTELERVKVDPILEDETLKFYGRYVDVTLLLVKPERVDEVPGKFDAYHRSLQFTVEKFENEVSHFLAWSYIAREYLYTESPHLLVNLDIQIKVFLETTTVLHLQQRPDPLPEQLKGGL